MNHFLGAMRKGHQVAEGAWFQKKSSKERVEIVVFAEKARESKKTNKKST